VLDRDVTLEDENLDYAGLAWSEDATKLLAVLNDKRVHVYDRQGKLVEKTKVIDGKDGPELPSGERLRNSGPLEKGVIARKGKSRIRIALQVERRELEKGARPGRLRSPGHSLAFTDLASGKTESVEVVLGLAQPAFATVSKDGRLLALVDE